MEIIFVSNEKLLGTSKAPNNQDLVQHMLSYMKDLGWNMSINRHYLNSGPFS